ncbi:Cadherin [Trinorchestia longiramus]|nr:Cadherin [Trinorchestia longiramus]
MAKLKTDIRVVMAQKQHFAAVFFYLAKAYDTAWKYNIVKKFHTDGIRRHMLHFIQNFLTDLKIKGIAGFDDDEHSSSARVTVRLLDVNDNRPVFGRHPDSVSVAEDAPPGYVVFSVPATDEDPGANGLLRYSIHPSGDPHGYFTVDASGSVRVGRSLDREAVHLYLLRIEAKDNGHPSLSARTTVIVQVTDVNDNAPTLVGSTHLRLPEPENASVSINFTIADADDWSRGHGPPFEAHIDARAAEDVKKRVRVSMLSGVFVTQVRLTAADPDNDGAGDVSNRASDGLPTVVTLTIAASSPDTSWDVASSLTVPVVLVDAGTPRLTATIPVTVTMTARGGRDLFVKRVTVYVVEVRVVVQSVCVPIYSVEVRVVVQSVCVCDTIYVVEVRVVVQSVFVTQVRLTAADPDDDGAGDVSNRASDGLPTVVTLTIAASSPDTSWDVASSLTVPVVLVDAGTPRLTATIPVTVTMTARGGRDLFVKRVTVYVVEVRVVVRCVCVAIYAVEVRVVVQSVCVCVCVPIYAVEEPDGTLLGSKVPLGPAVGAPFMPPRTRYGWPTSETPAHFEVDSYTGLLSVDPGAPPGVCVSQLRAAPYNWSKLMLFPGGCRMITKFIPSWRECK